MIPWIQPYYFEDQEVFSELVSITERSKSMEFYLFQEINDPEQVLTLLSAFQKSESMTTTEQVPLFCPALLDNNSQVYDKYIEVLNCGKSIEKLNMINSHMRFNRFETNKMLTAVRDSSVAENLKYIWLQANYS